MAKADKNWTATAANLITGASSTDPSVMMALNLVHIVGGLRELDAKGEILIELLRDISVGVGNLEDTGGKGDDGGGEPGGKTDTGSNILDIAIGNVVANGATKLFGVATSFFTTLTGSITRYLTPVAILTQAINSQASGYATFGKTFQVLGASIGIVLLPVFALLGSAVLAVSDQITSALLPNMEEWSTLILTNGISAIQYLVAATQAAGDTLTEFKQFLDAVGDSKFFQAIQLLVAGPSALISQGIWDRLSKPRTAENLGEGLGFGLNPLANRFQDNLKNRLAEQKQSNGIIARYTDSEGNERTDITKQPSKADAITGEISKYLQLFIAEQQRAVGGGSQSSSISDIGRQIQAAAFNASPFEQKILQIALQALQALQAAVAKLEKPVTT